MLGQIIQYSYLERMNKSVFSLLFFAILFSGCSNPTATEITSFEVFCEMVANDAKPIALSHPMDGNLADKHWNEFQQIADKYNVDLYREDEFPVSKLFPAAATNNKSVVLIYKGNRLKQYEQWKADLKSISNANNEQQVALARRLGRLLGYSPQGTNALLSKNSEYRSLASFKIEQQITHLYYEDVSVAIDFYKNTIGFSEIDSALFKISEDAYLQIQGLNADHPKDQPKSTAIAFLTDQLPEWYAYLQEQNVPIKYTYKPKDGGPHDGFVAIDPGGYLLEFEQFKQHSENELFMAVLEGAPRIETETNKFSFYGSITWTYHKDMLKMQQFYEEVLGYQMVADQGWTKIFQTSSTGFIGLVDECRGMENYAATKAVELEWKVEDVKGFDSHASQYWGKFSYNKGSFTGPEKYSYKIQ